MRCINWNWIPNLAFVIDFDTKIRRHESFYNEKCVGIHWHHVECGNCLRLLCCLHHQHEGLLILLGQQIPFWRTQIPIEAIQLLIRKHKLKNCEPQNEWESLSPISRWASQWHSRIQVRLSHWQNEPPQAPNTATKTKLITNLNDRIAISHSTESIK